MAKNKLYNLSYFTKRLVESGFNVIKLVPRYEYDDPRKWTVNVVNIKNASYKFNILITCFKDEKTKEFSFLFQGQQPREFTYKTLSMVLIIDLLREAMKPMEVNKEDDDIVIED